MKHFIFKGIDWFCWQFPKLVWLLLDHKIGRKIFLDKYLLNRPHYFEKYFKNKPCLFTPKRLLILKPDAIGDYVLFRNFFENILQSPQYKGFELYVIGNEVWKDLAISLDKSFVNRFFWINRNAWKNEADTRYRYQNMLEINRFTFHTVFYLNFSRETVLGDWIVKMTTAKQKIGIDGDLLCQTAEEKVNGNSAYSRLIQIPDAIHFEWKKNTFLGTFLSGFQNAEYPIIKRFPTSNQGFSEPYVVLVPGANAQFRKWSVKNFAAISLWLSTHKNLKTLVLGGKEDFEAGTEIEASNSKNVKNLCGKTILSELPYLLKMSTLVISNETGTVHFAAALHVPCICISNGNHFGRFNPYGLDWIKTIYPPHFEKLTFDEKVEKYGQGSLEDINSIEPELVIDSLLKILP